MNRSLSLSQIVFFAVGLLVTIQLTTFAYVFVVTGQAEQEKLHAISPMVLRAVSNDLLFNNDDSLNFTLETLKKVHNLEGIVVENTIIECPILDYSCAIFPINSLEPMKFLKLLGNKRIPNTIGLVFIAVLILSTTLSAVLAFVLLKRVRRPLNSIQATLLPSLSAHVAHGAELTSAPKDVALEIEAVWTSLVTMARNLRIATEMKKEVEQKLSVNMAIARTTAALAHDVRRPFSMFQAIIETVDFVEDAEEAKLLLRESLPEVQQAMASVNGMIADVLEVGADTKLFLEAANPESLIEANLHEIFRAYPDSKININYSLQHNNKVNVDTLKVGRVFSNILGNAVQAMGQKGELWFKTEEQEENEKHFVKFCLGNSGSFIPPESLTKLFDAFFTSGKKGGTGLGLAIAHKIITAHGGKIWCESDKQRGVEFFFTLPCSNELVDQRPTPLPVSSGEIISVYERLRKGTSSNGRMEPDPLEVTLEKAIVAHAKSAGVPLNILVVDDEGVYRNSIAALINSSADLKEQVSVEFAKNAQEAFARIVFSPLLIIQDVDLGIDSINGYEVLKILRAQGYKGMVCIHSNRTSADDFKRAIDAGADTVLPKPMSRAHLLKFILQAVKDESV